MRDERGDEHPQAEKREVHDATVDVIPRAIRLDGPRNRDPLPEHQSGKARRTGGAGTAESRARERGCIGVYLDTFEYQARPFYERLGYELFGTLEGYPPGYRQYYLAKRLAPPAPSA